MIALCARGQPLKEWFPSTGYINQCRQIKSAVCLYLKQNTSSKNLIKSMEDRETKTGVLIQSLKRQLKHIKTEIKLLGKGLESLVRQYDAGFVVNFNIKNTLPIITALSGCLVKLYE